MTGEQTGWGGSGNGVHTHCGHRTPWPTGAMAVVVVEPECVAVPCCSPLHLHNHLLLPREDPQPGRCIRGNSGHPAPGTACPAPWHRAWHPQGPSHPRYPLPALPRGCKPRQGDASTYLGTGGQQPLLQAMNNLWGQRVSGQGGLRPLQGTCRGSPGTRCCWLSLCRPREFMYAETWSSEPSGASKHRKITQPWAGKPPPHCGEAPAPPAPTQLPGARERDPHTTEMC